MLRKILLHYKALKRFSFISFGVPALGHNLKPFYKYSIFWAIPYSFHDSECISFLTTQYNSYFNSRENVIKLKCNSLKNQALLKSFYYVEKKILISSSSSTCNHYEFPSCYKLNKRFHNTQKFTNLSLT